MSVIRELVADNKDYVISLRRHFRMHPEVGGEEYETQKKIMEELKKLGIEYRVAAGTGLIAEIKGEKPGKTVAVRTDIDALPIQDEIDQSYRSQIKDRCHACGHDAHMAIALGTTRVLNSLRKDMHGTIRVLFQPSEEAFPGGAEAMIRDGAMDGVSAIVGAHIWQPFKAGTVGIKVGKTTAAPDEFTLTIQGKGGHGSMPHQTVDPLFLGAQLVMAFKSIVPNYVDPLENAVLSLGMFRSGEAFNIIPDTAVIKGTVRTFEQSVREVVFGHIERNIKGICDIAGASYKFEPLYGYPPVDNDRQAAAVAWEAVKESLGENGPFEMRPVMVGEDFSYYQHKAPGVFLFIGVGDESKKFIYPHHHPRFDFDETALAGGVEVMARTALRLLGNS